MPQRRRSTGCRLLHMSRVHWTANLITTLEELPVSDKMIKRVQALLDKAASTEFPEERETLLAKADELMAKYSIEQFQLEAQRIASGEAASLKVESVNISATGDQAYNITEMIYQIGELIGAKGIFTRTGKDMWGDKDGVYTVRFYGFRMDLDYLERLNAMLQMAIIHEINPEVNRDETFDHNVYRLHEAGLKWKQILNAVNVGRIRDGVELWPLTPWPDGGRLKRAYERECAALGVAPHAVLSSKGYRDAFMTGFSQTVITRIREVRRIIAEQPGTELVLRDKSAQINDAFNEAHPETKSLARSSRGRFDAEGHSRGVSAGQRADIGQTRVGGNSAKALS